MLLSEWMEQAVRNQPLCRGEWARHDGAGCLMTATAREMGIYRRLQDYLDQRDFGLEVKRFLWQRIPALALGVPNCDLPQEFILLVQSQFPGVEIASAEIAGWRVIDAIIKMYDAGFDWRMIIRWVRDLEQRSPGEQWSFTHPQAIPTTAPQPESDETASQVAAMCRALEESGDPFLATSETLEESEDSSLPKCPQLVESVG